MNAHRYAQKRASLLRTRLKKRGVLSIERKGDIGTGDRPAFRQRDRVCMRPPFRTWVSAPLPVGLS